MYNWCHANLVISVARVWFVTKRKRDHLSKGETHACQWNDNEELIISSYSEEERRVTFSQFWRSSMMTIRGRGLWKMSLEGNMQFYLSFLCVWQHLPFGQNARVWRQRCSQERKSIIFLRDSHNFDDGEKVNRGPTGYEWGWDIWSITQSANMPFGRSGWLFNRKGRWGERTKIANRQEILTTQSQLNVITAHTNGVHFLRSYACPNHLRYH